MAQTTASRVIRRVWELRPTLTGTAVSVGLGVIVCLLAGAPVVWGLVVLPIGAAGIAATAYIEIRREDTGTGRQEQDDVDSA